jgi:GntR family transcriptional repressor for pyruvate dehydrogenase complex
MIPERAVRMTVEPIAKTSLVDAVVGRLRALIEQGDLRAGDRLPTETELVARLGVSRGALREAIRRLETLGLLRVAQGRGMFVAGGSDLSGCVSLFRSAMAISAKDSLQFAELRRILEVYTARRAAELATPADIAELEELIERKTAGGPTMTDIHWDWLFHRKLAELTGNDLIHNVVQVLQEFVMAGIWHTAQAQAPGEERRSYKLHKDIVAAIRAGDPDRAEQAMHRHMDALVRTLRRADKTAARNPPAS